LSGEFLKWFTTNFAGENREELDFLSRKHDIWYATATLASDIINAYQRLPGNHEIILTQEWWQRQRHSRLGQAIAQKLNESPELKQELRQLFKSQQDKLSYYDLFQFINKKLMIELEDWEADGLENRLDKLGMAFVEFNEFNEFSLAYSLEWGEPLLENDHEEQLEKKLNRSYKDYEVTDADLFQGCSTMLRSEKAALAQVRAIYYGLKEKGKKKFHDEDFGSRGAGDKEGSALSMYKKGTIPCPGYPEPETVEWVSAAEICPPGTAPQFVDDGAGANDAKQGALGDCWFIGALSVIVTRDELLRGGRQGLQYDPDMIIDQDLASALSMGVYPPIFHRFRMKGIFVLRFFKNFEWIYVIIDDRLPVNIESKQPVFGSCVKPHELWVALIEKAYAKVHGCYE